MELGSSVSQLLAACDCFSDAQLRTAAATAVAAVAEGAQAEATLGVELGVRQREAYAGLALLLTETARLQLPPAVLRSASRPVKARAHPLRWPSSVGAASLLAEHGFSDARAQLVTDAYELGADALRDTLKRTAGACALPRLRSAAWRLDAPLASSSARGRLGAAPPPLFHLTLLGTAATAASWGVQQSAGAPTRDGELLCCSLDAEQLQQLALVSVGAIDVSG
jgi:hypothetical protein